MGDGETADIQAKHGVESGKRCVAEMHPFFKTKLAKDNIKVVFIYLFCLISLFIHQQRESPNDRRSQQ